MKDRVGEKWVTNEGYEIEIIEYLNSKNITIKFSCGNILSNIMYGNIIKGRVRNPFIPNVYNTGFVGSGKYEPNVNKARTVCYYIWKNMLKRCYSEIDKSYSNIHVVKEWHNFQNFAEWFYTKSNYQEGFHLDKDILSINNKVYSPETCTFIPQEVNKLLIKSNIFSKVKTSKSYLNERGTYRASLNIRGKAVSLKRCKTQEEAMNTYKVAKENYIKEVANKYKNVLEKQVFETLINHKI